MSQPSKQDLERVILEAQQQIQMQAQQALMEKMNTICFRRCVPSPVDVGDRQRRCLQQCVGAFLEGWGVAVRAFSLRFVKPAFCGAQLLAFRASHCWPSRSRANNAVSPFSHPTNTLQPTQNETFASIAKKQMASSGGGHE